MSEQVKDFALDADEGLDKQNAIAEATKALRAQLEAKQAEADQLRRVAADRDAAARNAEARVAQGAANETQSHHIAITAALREHDAQLEILRTALAQAVETADGKTAADLNIRIADVVQARRTLQQGKDQIEEEIKAERAKPPAPPPPPADPYEAAIAHLHPEQQKWLRLHKDKGYLRPGQPPSNDLMIAHHAALKAGLAEASPQYFAAMDRVLKHNAPAAEAAPAQQSRAPEQEQAEDASQRFAETPAEAPAPKPQTQQRKVMPAAPVTRSAGGNSSGGSGKSFRLTAAENETAQRLNMTPQQYRQFQEVAVARGKLPASVLTRG